MALSEHNEADVPAPTFAVQRMVLYVVAVVALFVVLWALMDGGDRDLWTQPVGLLLPTIPILAP